MSVAKDLAWNTGVQIAGKAVSTGLGVFIVGFLTRYLGQEGFGIYTTANAYLQIFSLIIDLGLNITLVAMLGEHANDKAYETRAVSAFFTLRVIMSIIMFGIAPLIWIGLYPKESLMAWAITALTGSFFFPSVNQIVIGVQQRYLKMAAVAIGENIGRIILIAGLFLARAQGWGLLPILTFVSLASFGNVLFNWLNAKRLAQFRWNWDPAFWKQALQRSWPIGVSMAFNLIYFKADTLILSRVRPYAETGVYGAAYRVLEILISIPFLYTGILLPVLSKTWAKNDRATFGRYISRSTEAMWILAAPIVAGTLALGPSLLALVAGQDFRASGEIMRILVLAVAIIFINTIYAYSVVAISAQKRMMPVYIFDALLILAGYFYFIPRDGMWAAAWLTVLSEAIILVGNRYIVRTYIPSQRDLSKFLRITAAAVLMGLLVWFVKDAWIGIPLLVGAISYPTFLFAFRGLEAATIRELLTVKGTE